VINAFLAHFFFCLRTMLACIEYLAAAARRNKKPVSIGLVLLLGLDSWGEYDDGFRDAKKRVN
jgi:hypothetical protein